jgi:acetylornithine deacetylase/succinyl-diaminopimelate desuccinylase-like protein
MFPGDTATATRAALIGWIADPEVTVSTPPPRGASAAAPPATDKVMGPVIRASAKVWPGVPVVQILMPAATDGTALNAAGIPTYGITGLFRDADGGGIHGLNERIRVSSVMQGRDFLYGVVKDYADQKD